MNMFLNKTIRSHFKPSHVYGNTGDEVEVVSESGTVKIVKHLGSNDRFSVNDEDLSSEKEKSVIPIIQSSNQTIISNTASTKKGKDAKYKPTLF